MRRSAATIPKLITLLKGAVRRRRDTLFPDTATREYRAWMGAHTARRARLYDAALEPGLLSIVTAVWDGSPLRYFRQLAASLVSQLEGARAQWVIVANGCKRADLLAWLAHLEENPLITIVLAEKNTGITGGLRLGLEQASGTYILPVDADDRLYPDALRVITAHIQRNGYPALLYTDEDKVSSGGVYQPYFKPVWDPVLLANSAYIAHLGVIDRRLALDLGAYSDQQAEGSPDWDLFTRFTNAGYQGVHIPEVVYSWRIHAESTADDAATKPYIRSSQEAVLRRFLLAQAEGDQFEIEPSLLFGPGAAHLRIVSHRTQDEAGVQVVSNADSLQSFDRLADQPFVAIVARGFTAVDISWIGEAMTMFDLFPDTVMVGGRISSVEGMLIDGPRVFGFRGAFGCPDAGRKLSDPGYFGQAWKHRSVSAVSAGLSLIRTSTLRAVLGRIPREATFANLGCWMGAETLSRQLGRIVYNPYLHAVDRIGQAPLRNRQEEQCFTDCYADLLPDRRFYPEPFSLTDAYRIG